MLCQFRKGDALFHAGDTSRFVFRIISGEATTTVEPGEAAAATLRAGEFVGEIGVLVGLRRSTTVHFTSAATVARYDRRDYLRLIASDGTQALRLLHALSLRTRSLIEVLGQVGHGEDFQGLEQRPGDGALPKRWWEAVRRWLASLRRYVLLLPSELRGREISDYDLALTMDGVVEIEIPAGADIFADGASSQCVYWIKSGIVHAVKATPGGRQLIGEIWPGEFLGEIGILESAPRSAGAIAATDVVAQILPAEEFFRLLVASPRTFNKVVDSLCQRAQRLEKRVQSLRAASASTAPEPNFFALVGRVESVAQLAEQRMVNEALKMRKFFNAQIGHGREMIQVYQKYLRGQATKEEMDRANAHFRDYLKLAGLGTLLILPGAPLTIPLAVKMGKVVGIDVLPSADEVRNKDAGD